MCLGSLTIRSTRQGEMTPSLPPESEQVVAEFLRALDALDKSRVRLVLHPYLRWSEGETTLRGRNGVLQHLTD